MDHDELTMISNEPDLLRLMMDDLAEVSSLYQPGNYWKTYEDGIIDQLCGFDISNFRNGVYPSGTIRSFGGGGEIMRRLDDPYFPWDPEFCVWGKRRITKITNAMIALLAKIYPALQSLLLRRWELASFYFTEALAEKRKQAYAIAKLMDNMGRLDSVEDTCAGNPEVTTVGDKSYSLTFLNKFTEYCYMSKFINFEEINNVIELGSGIGMQAQVLKLVEPRLNLCLFDIPPQMYLAHQFLRAVFENSFVDYQETRALKILDDRIWDKGSIMILGAWRIEDVSFVPDLFINEESFQEMEKPQVENYLRKITETGCKYIYLRNLSKGHYQADKSGKRGVLEPASCDFMEDVLSSHYVLVDRRQSMTAEGLLSDNEQMLFARRN